MLSTASPSPAVCVQAGPTPETAAAMVELRRVAARFSELMPVLEQKLHPVLNQKTECSVKELDRLQLSTLLANDIAECANSLEYSAEHIVSLLRRLEV